MVELRNCYGSSSVCCIVVYVSLAVQPTNPGTIQQQKTPCYNYCGRDTTLYGIQLLLRRTRMAHPFIPVPNVASVEMIWLHNGSVVENVFHVRKGSPFTLADLQALRAVCNSWDSVTWVSLRPAVTTLQRIRTKALDTNSSPMEDFALPIPRAGGNGSQSLPGNVTFSIKLGTGLAGRSFRGRWYVAGLCLNHTVTNANQMVASVATNMVAGLNTLLTNLAAAGYTLGVVSYRTGGAYRVTGVFTPAISWTSVDLNLDSMRRRLTGRGI